MRHPTRAGLTPGLLVLVLSQPAAQLSLKMGTYKPASVCDIPDTAGAGRAYCICSMAGLPIDTENHLKLSARKAASFTVIFGRDPQACAA